MIPVMLSDDEKVALAKFRANIGAARRGAGMTESQLADAAGIDVGTLQQLERGMANPHTSDVCDLAEAVGIVAQIYYVAASSRRCRCGTRGQTRVPRLR